MGKISQLFLNSNYRFFAKNDLIYFFNIATSKQIKVKLNTKIEKEALMFLLDNLQIKNNKFNNIKKEFLFKFPSLGEKWLVETINKFIELNIFSRSKKPKSFFSEKYLLGLDRQLAFLEALFPKEGVFFKQKQLKDAKIACLGVGVISQYIILPLLASGVGNFILVDFDKVETRNIGRQPIFRKEDVGRPKIDVIRDFIKQNRFGVKVKAINTMIKSPQDVEKLVKDSDIITQTCDYPRFEVRRWINKACLKLKKPNIVVYSGRIGPFCIPYKTSCYGCLEMRMKELAPFYEDFAEKIKKEGMRRYPELAFVPALCGVIAAREIISFILGVRPETFNAFLDINPSTFQIVRHFLPKYKNCYACGKQKK